MGGNTTAWIGADYDDASITYNDWLNNKPNQAGDDDCIKKYPKERNTDRWNGKWNEIDCNNPYYSTRSAYICQIRTVDKRGQWIRRPYKGLGKYRFYQPDLYDYKLYP